MKITKSQLKQIIKEELEVTIRETHGLSKEDKEEELADDVDYADGMKDAKDGKPIRKDASPAYLEGWAEGDGGALDETDDEKKSPDDIVARFPSSRPGEPDQVIYRWQQEEFDERERALKTFDKRKKK